MRIEFFRVLMRILFSYYRVRGGSEGDDGKSLGESLV